MRWIIATRSRGKLTELVPMLADRGIAAVGLEDAGIAHDRAEDDIECYASFEENALAKARWFAALTKLPCLADDSGLCIDALDGRPGVRSRRFAVDERHVRRSGASDDDANNDAMLDACWNSGWAPPWAAHFACVAAFVDVERELCAHGRTDGVIVPEPSGTGGFGYDPYFVSTTLDVSFAVASREQKARVSHRARAIEHLLTRVLADGSAASGR
ncbi:MAG: non-canonical purine NTP pyrophosphatase [Gemmatimonadaceae bacterium]|nr:non-canonical purine NTP pyrophosphatase [Gemmatimonadaceae bacterium]